MEGVLAQEAPAQAEAPAVEAAAVHRAAVRVLEAVMMQFGTMYITAAAVQAEEVERLQRYLQEREQPEQVIQQM